MKANRILLLIMAICLANGVKAQFYDGPSDIYFYVTAKDNFNQSGPNEITDYYQDPVVVVFNFDGLKAVRWESHVSTVKKLLQKNPNYFEDQEENVEYKLQYVASSGSGTNYKYYSFGSWTTLHFSVDRKVLYSNWPWKQGNSIRYVRVDKSYFKPNLGRSRTPKSTLYE